MARNEFFQVGIITAAHGVHGEVKVFPTTDDSRRFKKLKSVILEDNSGRREVEIVSVKLTDKFAILKLKGLDDRNEAERLRNAKLFVSRENAVPLGKDEYYIADLIGLPVYDNESGSLIGKVTEVIQTGANDVYEIEFDDGFEYNGEKPKEDSFLAPVIKECITDIDIEDRICMNIMPGLI